MVLVVSRGVWRNIFDIFLRGGFREQQLGLTTGTGFLLDSLQCLKRYGDISILQNAMSLRTDTDKSAHFSKEIG